MTDAEKLVELANLVIDLQQAESQFVDSKYDYVRCQNMGHYKERLFAKATAILDGQAAPIHPFHILHNDFFTWADDYFSSESGRLNTMVEFRQAINDFWTAYPGHRSISSLKFRKLLGGWAMTQNCILNPTPLLNNQGRIMRRVNGLICQMVFIKTADQPLTPAAWASDNTPLPTNQALAINSQLNESAA